MATPGPTRDRIGALKREYDALRRGRESLLTMIDEVEIPESVYNSNAIENSTLTLDETERILLEQSLSREVSVREVFEARNLARVTEYKRARAEESELDEEWGRRRSREPTCPAIRAARRKRRRRRRAE